MKRFTLMFAMVVALILGVKTTASAQATRHAVIVEIGTGTWCQYCPGAALGADDLHNSTAKVGIVEHHDSDPYETTEDATRIGATYYNVTGFPTAFFDGGNSVVGGSHTNSMYSSYLQKYNTAMAVATPFDITTTWAQNGASIDVTVVVNQVGAYSAGNLRLQSVLTESHIQVNWQGQSECNFINRDMYPDQNGQALSLTQGNSQTLTFNLPISPSWHQDQMELVVWVENSSTKQIFNGTYAPLANAAFTNDPNAVSIDNEIASPTCINSIAPIVKFRNLGSAPLTSVDFSYNVNGGTPMTYTWTGNLPFLSYGTATLPAINFTNISFNSLTVNITNSNDNNMGNNLIVKTWSGTAPIHAAGAYVFSVTVDHYGSECTWDIKNSAGATVASGGPYTDTADSIPLVPVNVNVTINPNDCYTITMHDAYGDGICCAYGAGSYSLKDPSNNVVASGGSYGSSEAKAWSTGTTVAVSNNVATEISVYPNPSHGVFNVEIPNVTNADISIVNMAGKLVYTTVATQSLVKVDLSDLAAGMYMVRVKTQDGFTVKKITKE